jgi:predicted O-methyltransferase YrrM
VRASRPAVVLEIGSARGKSTCSLALACRQNGCGKVYSIDPHTQNSWTDVGVGENSYAFLKARIREYHLEQWCEVVVATSAVAAQNWARPIDILFIDGDHTYEGVKFDFSVFEPWLTPKALVLFHDTTWEYLRNNEYYRSDMGVPRFMRELQGRGYHSATIDAPPGLTILVPKPGGFIFVP